MGEKQAKLASYCWCAVYPKGRRKFQVQSQSQDRCEALFPDLALSKQTFTYLVGFVHICACTQISQHTCMDLRRQVVTVSLFLPPCGSQDLNSGHPRHDFKHLCPLSHPDSPQLRSWWDAHLRTCRTTRKGAQRDTQCQGHERIHQRTLAGCQPDRRPKAQPRSLLSHCLGLRLLPLNDQILFFYPSDQEIQVSRDR